jgi:uncharacterized protein (TIGR02444 family)
MEVSALLPLDNPFWQFSLWVYAQPEVAAECLELQRVLSINVNVLLFCSWIAASRRIALGAADIRLLESEIHDWHRLAVLPLREIRDTLKPASEMQYQTVQAFRERILASELHAEQIEQALLFQRAESLSRLPDSKPIRDIIAGNIELLCSLSPIPVPAETSVLALIEASLVVAEHGRIRH